MRLPMSTLLCAALAVWGMSCFLIHGTTILAYVGLQVVTSGAFAWAMCRTEQKAHASREADQPASD